MPDYAAGANRLSLNQARANFEAFGACDEAAREHVRPARQEEQPTPGNGPFAKGMNPRASGFRDQRPASI
jgi:hypothetical protein